MQRTLTVIPSYVCQDGGCCPSGEICVGSSGPPITIGGGNDPTETETFIPTTTHHTTTTRRTSTSTTITFDGTTESNVFPSATAPATTRTATTGTGAELTTTRSSSSASIGSEPTADASNTPLSGVVNGAARTVQNLGMTAVLALSLGIAMQFA
ncbi:hypothetical protein FKP32DRAFT_898432 [Trametes sanguinea]|nr:hypothetical protein FKP32DRAFT_898432 [Trametes sanguinea]